jgi:hypothetical protein
LDARARVQPNPTVILIIDKLDFRKIASLFPKLQTANNLPVVPRFANVRSFQKYVDDEGPVSVYMRGASSSETSGKLVKVKEKPDHKEQLAINCAEAPQHSDSESSPASLQDFLFNH